MNCRARDIQSKEKNFLYVNSNEKELYLVQGFIEQRGDYLESADIVR